MTDVRPRAGRRRFFRLLAVTAAAPLGSALVNRHAFAAETVGEADPAAVAVKYKADATRASERKDPAAFCDNCSYFTGKPGSADGPCAVLGNRLVAAKGWCTAWEGY
jgi:hypothetical protein